MPMVDPMDALLSFNDALKQNLLQLHKGEIDKDLYVHIDRPEGETRMTYTRIVGKVAFALVTFVQADSVGDEPCFGIGYAVLPTHRGKGIASNLVKAATIELLNGFGRNGVPILHIEAIVGVENYESQRVAEKTISKDRTTANDEHSGEPAFQYINRFKA